MEGTRTFPSFEAVAAVPCSADHGNARPNTRVARPAITHSECAAERLKRSDLFYSGDFLGFEVRSNAFVAITVTAVILSTRAISSSNERAKENAE